MANLHRFQLAARRQIGTGESSGSAESITASGSGRSRRQFLLAAFGTVAIGGCVPATAKPDSVPELVWGRRGLSEGRFLKPRAITIDPADNLYIVDTTGRIQVFDTDGNFLRAWKTPETENGRPTGLAYYDGPSGPRILVADTHYYRMLVYQPDGTLMPSEQIGGTRGNKAGQFAFVTDAVCDADGCFYIGEYNFSDRIQKFDPDGKFVTHWGGTGEQPGEFVRPQSLVVSGQTLLVADSCNHRIQRFDLSQQTPELIDIWGSLGRETGEFYFPYDIVLDQDGSLIVCEYGGQRLQRLSSNGNFVASWGKPGFSPGQLYQPWGVVVDSQGRVHVLDSNNHRVQRLKMPVA